VSGPGYAAGEELLRLAPTIVERALERERLRWPGLFRSLSEKQIEMTTEDTRTHVEFLAAGVWSGEQVLFSDYVGWCKVLFHNLEMPLEWLTGGLEDVRDAVADIVRPEFALTASEVADAALAEFDSFPLTIDSYLEPGQPLGGPRFEYLKAVLNGDRRTAGRIVFDAIDGGVPVRDIYQYFFVRTQIELGRLWQSNLITVTQEHIATEVTRAVMAQLYPRVNSLEKGPYTIVVAGTGAETHGIAAQVVADFFEMAHWETFYVGANTPIGPTLETVVQVGADVLALSATMSNHVIDVAHAIQALRDDPRTVHVRVLVGGYPFNLAPELWRTVGANGTAPTAHEGVLEAERILGTRPSPILS